MMLERKERSFPWLLLRKSCSSLQPEYSWATEAATIFYRLPPLSPYSWTQVTTCTVGLSWPQHQQLWGSRGSTPLCQLKVHLIQVLCGRVKTSWSVAVTGETDGPRLLLLSHADAFGDENSDARMTVCRLAHCEFIASTSWSDSRTLEHKLSVSDRMHEQHARSSITTCADLVCGSSDYLLLDNCEAIKRKRRFSSVILEI